MLINRLVRLTTGKHRLSTVFIALARQSKATREPEVAGSAERRV
jgi:hypothetical protein